MFQNVETVLIPSKFTLEWINDFWSAKQLVINEA